MPAIPESVYDCNRPGAPPFHESRRIKDIFWGDVAVAGGLDPDDYDAGLEYVQMPFVWDPGANDWVSLSTFKYQLTIDLLAAPSGVDNYFKRVAGSPDADSASGTVPGDGYIVMIQGGYGQEAGNTLDNAFEIELTQLNYASSSSRLMASLAFPEEAMANIANPTASWKLTPPLAFSRKDEWQFHLVNGTGVAGWPWIDVYWRFRHVPSIGADWASVAR